MSTSISFGRKNAAFSCFPPKKKAQLRSHRPLRSYHAHTLASGQQPFLPSGASKLTLQPSSTTFPTLKGWSWLPEQQKGTNPASFLLSPLCVCVFFSAFQLWILFFESELLCKVCVDSHVTYLSYLRESKDPSPHLMILACISWLQRGQWHPATLAISS